jgi:ubiquinone/menaquinone biosynthesis C-methylase UbiE
MRIDYTDLSKTYDDFRSYPEELMRQTVEFGAIRRGMKVLDLGCGTGNVATGLQDMVEVDVIGVDVSAPMLEKANTKSLQVVCADVERDQMPFRNDVFDRILSVYVIHQIRDLALMFSECRRILKDGALVLLTSGHAQIEHQHPVIKEFFPSFIEIEQKRFPDIPQIESLLEDTGFSNVTHREVKVEGIPLDETFLKKVKNKYISTYCLLPKDEYEKGVEKLETFINNRSQPEQREWHGILICGS